MIHKLCDRRDLPAEGTLRAVRGLGLDLCLVVVNSQPFAVENRCPHQGAPLSAGTLAGDTLICPLHAWRFHLSDGSPEHPGDPSLVTFDLRTIDDVVFIRIPD